MKDWFMFGYRSVVMLGLLCLAEGAFAAMALTAAEIISIERGTVQVRRRGESDYEPGDVETLLYAGDAVLPSRRARVEVECPNGSRQSVTAGRLSGMRVICPDLERSTDGKNPEDLLQLLAGEFPYGPRALMATPPAFDWPTALDANVYQVAVVQLQFVQPESRDPFTVAPPELVETVIWEATAMDTRILYGGPALIPDERYQLRVMTEAGLHYTVPFQGVSLSDSEALALATAALNSQELPWGDQALALAYLQFEKALFWEVIEGLRPLMAASGATAAEHRLLAASYLQTGRYGLAKLTMRQRLR